MAEKLDTIEEALSKVDNQLTCPVCLESYSTPRLLACFHVYCESCLGQIVTDGKPSITCPECRCSTSLPATGVTGLQAAFYIHHLFDIRETLQKIKEPQKLTCEKCSKTTRQATSFCRDCTKFLCGLCTSMHNEWEEFESHKVVSMEKVKGDLLNLVPPKQRLNRCPRHNKRLEFYCNTCEELICHHCTVQIHKDHHLSVIADSIETHKRDIIDSLEPVKKQLEEINEALGKIEARQRDIAKRGEKVKIEIQSNYQLLRKALEESKAKNMAEADKLVQQKLKNLDAQKDEVEVMRTQRNSCAHLISESVRTGSQEEVMKSKKQLVKQTKELSDCLHSNALVICEQDDITFVPSPDLKKWLSGKFGTVCQHEKVPFYRYFNGHEHFYTHVAKEIGTVTQGEVGNYGYKAEGIQCYLYATKAPGTVPLYRYCSNITGDHLYTTDAEEIGTTVSQQTGKHGYHYESIAGYCFPKNKDHPDECVAVHRGWNGNDHFYSTNKQELTNNNYKYEGVAFYTLKK